MATLVVVAKWDAVVSTFDKGAEIEKMEIIKSDMKAALQDTSVLNAAFSNPNFVATFFNNPTVNKKIEELGVELHANVVNKIISKDSTKISSRDYFSAKINMHPDSVLAFQANFWRKVKDGQVATKKELEEYVDKEMRTVIF